MVDQEIESIFRFALIEEKFGSSKDIVFGSLQRLKDYLDLFHGSIDEQVKREKEGLARLFASMSQSQREAYMAYHFDDSWYHILTSQFYYSFIIWSFSVFEDLLAHICRDMKTAAQTPIRWDELRGQNKFDQAHKYFQKLLDFTQPNEDTWKKLNDSYLIRNVIVHNGGCIVNANKEQHIRKLISEMGHGISLEQDHLKITSEHCHEVIQLLHLFTSAAYLSLDELCDKIVATRDKTQ